MARLRRLQRLAARGEFGTQGQSETVEEVYNGLKDPFSMLDKNVLFFLSKDEIYPDLQWFKNRVAEEEKTALA